MRKLVSVAICAISSVAQPTSADPKAKADPIIDRVEFVQTIQTLQTLDDLQKSLAATGQPPVPLLAGKFAALRIYTVTGKGAYTFSVTLPGKAKPEESQVTLGKETAAEQRFRPGAKAAAVHIFTPPVGDSKVIISVLDDKKNVVQGPLEFKFTKTQAQKILNIALVLVCDAKDAKEWLCPKPRTVSDAALKPYRNFMIDILPINDLKWDRPAGNIEVERKKFPGDVSWFSEVLKEIGKKAAAIEKKNPPPAGTHTMYLGLARSQLRGTLAGMAGGILSRTALALEETKSLGQTDTAETWTHEIGHGLGLRHTNTELPKAEKNKPPGCYLPAKDGTAAATAQWGFKDNRIQSAEGVVEIGYRPSSKSVMKYPPSPDNMMELMGYCFPQWISPIKFNEAAATLRKSAALPPLAVQNPSSTTDSSLNFWELGGVFSNGQLILDPLFIDTLPGPALSGSGSYIARVLDSNGSTLFEYHFEPELPIVEQPIDDSITADPFFHALIPVVSNASRIVILDPSGFKIGEKIFQNALALVQVQAPSSNMTLSGIQTASWTVTGVVPGRTVTSRVEYSPDSGGAWYDLGRIADLSLPIDFDALPGTSGFTGVLRVSASDGANVATALSGSFAVTKKQPSDPEIANPANGSAFGPSDPVLLEGGAYDGDDGILQGPAIRWSSSIDGALGSGEELIVPHLSPGRHVITMTATDSDGNKVSTTIDVSVAAGPPVLSVGLHSNSGCVAAIDVRPDPYGSLADAAYSLDGGGRFTDIPLNSLPFEVTLKGASPVDLIGRATDQAGQLGTVSVRVLPSVCTAQ